MTNQSNSAAERSAHVHRDFVNKMLLKMEVNNVAARKN